MVSAFNRKAEEFADKHGLAKIAASDSHFPGEIGSSYTIVNSNSNKNDILEAIVNGKTELFCKKTGIKPHWRTFKQNVKRKL